MGLTVRSCSGGIPVTSDKEMEEMLAKWERCDRVVGFFLCIAALSCAAAAWMLL